MSKLMMILGVILGAIGIALGLMVFFSPGAMQVVGVTLEAAAVFLVGGVLAFGLGGVITALEAGPTSVAARPPLLKPDEPVSRAAAAVAVEPLSPAVSETIQALEKAKTDLQQAFGDEEAPAPAEVETAEEPEAEAVKVQEEAESVAEEEEVSAEEEAGQLYVLEERTVRGHPARMLSDGTVEAETKEGWMRFENLEHLDEYLDAMEP